MGLDLNLGNINPRFNFIILFIELRPQTEKIQKILCISLGEYGADVNIDDEGKCGVGISNVDMTRFAKQQKEALADRSDQMFRDCEGLANQC